MGKESVTTDTDSTSADLSSHHTSAVGGERQTESNKVTKTPTPAEADNGDPLSTTTTARNDTSCDSNGAISTTNNTIKNNEIALEDEGKKENIEPDTQKATPEFKLRIVPLENLLEKPSEAAAKEKRSSHSTNDNGKENTRRRSKNSFGKRQRVLPECTKRTESIIELTDSSASSSDNDEDDDEVKALPTKTKSFLKKVVTSNSESESSPPLPTKRSSRRNTKNKENKRNGGSRELRGKVQRVLPERTKRTAVSIIELTDSSTSSSSSDNSDVDVKASPPTQRQAATRKAADTASSVSVPRTTQKSRPVGDGGRDTEFVVRRCVVRVKRCQLLTTTTGADSKPAKATKKMNGGDDNSRLSPISSSNSNSSSLAALIAAAETATRPEQKTSSSAAAAPLAAVDDKMDDEHSKNNTEKVKDEVPDEDADETEADSTAAPEEDDDDGESSDSDGGSDSSGSEVMPVRKRLSIKKRRNSDSDFEPSRDVKRARKSSSDESRSSPSKKSKKRSRIVKRQSASEDSDADGDDEHGKNKRKHIRKIIKTKDLDISTKTATKEEEERRKRIEERQKIYNQIYVKPESTEVSELVLDFDEETKEPLLAVDKGLLKKLKPHQVSGVKFMFDACFETVKDMQEKPGSGCILAHCMGLGKTLQIVTLSHTLISNASKTHVERVLIISPLSTLNNWAREFNQWMSYARKRNIEIYDMSRYKDKPFRIFKLNEWFEEGGVCILGYDMYRILANEKAKGLKKKQRETLQKALVDPGPDLVVCDEGHLLKNEKTSISKAVTKMRTKRRIVLTGTPLQNNLKEYYCMIQFVKPNLLGTYKEYLNRFVNPITNGQYTDSTERDIRLMKHRSHILHKMLEGCIQRRDYSVLAPYLPVKNEYVVYTTLSELQQQLYDYYMCTQRELSTSDIGGKGARLFQDFQDLRRIWTHPMNLRVNSDTVIRKRVLANDSDSMEDFICDDDDDEDGGAGNSDGSSSVVSVNSSKSFASGSGGVSKPTKKRKTRNTHNLDGTDSEDDMPLQSAVEKDDPSEWWKRFVEEKELNNIHHSPKLVILMRLLQECEKLGDKVLVFSQSLQSLDVIEHFLSLIDSRTKGHEFEGDVGQLKGFWSPGHDYFRLDGSCSVENREAMCKKFNNTTNLRARLFLISTRAGGLGINLVAANRVVIFDVSWNPSHDTQSIFRVYRFGQEKPCYIYRLIAMGTMEQKVYERQVAKQATAKRVIDEQQISRHYNQSDLQELYTYELKPSAERVLPLLPKDRLFAELLSEHADILFKYHEHDSLLENDHTENLSEAERKAAWDEYEAEKTRAVNPYAGYSTTGIYPAPPVIPNNQYGNASGSVTSNKIFGFRSDVLLQLLNMKIVKDRPDLTQNQVIQLVPAYLQTLYTEMNNGDPTMYKDLLSLHTTLSHSSGMYMNPLLYANQHSEAAGYAQSGSGASIAAAPTVPAPGFEPDKVYEID